MPVGYKYKRVEPWDAAFVWHLIERDVARPLLGITEREDELILFFDRELTEKEKQKLDKIMSKPPTPVRYEFGVKDLKDEVERLIGVRPVRVEYDEVRGHAVIDFDRELTREQELALSRLFEDVKGLRSLKRVR